MACYAEKNSAVKVLAARIQHAGVSSKLLNVFTQPSHFVDGLPGLKRRNCGIHGAKHTTGFSKSPHAARIKEWTPAEPQVSMVLGAYGNLFLKENAFEDSSLELAPPCSCVVVLLYDAQCACSAASHYRI